MNLFNITLINIKRFLKMPQIIMVVVIQVVFIFIFSMNNGRAVNVFVDISIINKDTGIYSNELIDYLRNRYSLSILESTDGLKEGFIENYNKNFFTLKDTDAKSGKNPMTFVMVCYFMLIGASTIS